jgi:hypothetical protein
MRMKSSRNDRGLLQDRWEWIIAPQSLAPGDVIVSNSRCFESWIIRTATSSQASHVALHVGGAFVVDAGETREHAEVFVELCDSLRWSELWDRNDWQETLG